MLRNRQLKVWTIHAQHYKTLMKKLKVTGKCDILGLEEQCLIHILSTVIYMFSAIGVRVSGLLNNRTRKFLNFM